MNLYHWTVGKSIWIDLQHVLAIEDNFNEYYAGVYLLMAFRDKPLVLADVHCNEEGLLDEEKRGYEALMKAWRSSRSGPKD